MILSYEVLLVVGIVGFYLFDSAMLLYANELVFAKGQRWHFSSQRNQWQMAGKNLYLPNPFTPGRALFRFAWSLDEPVKPKHLPVADLPAFLKALRPLALFVDLLWMWVLLLLPLVLFRFGTSVQLLFALGLIYSTILLAVLFIFLRRKVLALSGKEVLKIGIEAIACPPFSLNLLRKISLRKKIPLDPVLFAKNQFDDRCFAAFVDDLCEQIDGELRYEDKTGDRCGVLMAVQQRLRGSVVSENKGKQK